MLILPDWHTALLEEVLGYRLNAANVARRLAPHVQKLSTYQRDYVKRLNEDPIAYLRHPSARDAYFAYFSTVNMMKLYRPLSELSESGFFDSPRAVLDIGCGPGTAYLGLSAWLQDMEIDEDVSFHAADVLLENISYTSAVHSAMEKLGEGTVRGFSSSLFDIARPPAMERKFDLIILMNVVNEVPGRAQKPLAEWLAERLTPDGAVLFIDPALKVISRRLLRLRDDIVESGWTVYAPCFRQANCPALQSPRDWCHTEENWERPSYIEEIDAIAGLVKLSLKYTYIIANRHSGTLEGALGAQHPLYRSVSDTFKEKGRTRIFLCGEHGRDQYLFNHRDKTPANKKIQKARRYDIFGVANTERRPGDVVIGKESIIEPIETVFDELS